MEISIKKEGGNMENGKEEAKIKKEKKMEEEDKFEKYLESIGL
jgi:hypothetical protein